MKQQHNLLWLDLEMTGLHPEKDVILEVAAQITDHTAMQYISEPFHHILWCDEDTLEKMNSWCKEQHTKSGLVAQVRMSSITMLQADELLCEYAKPYAHDKQLILCGNSIWQDRLFMSRYLPRTHELLHYRMIDVSSLKQLIRAWYPACAESYYQKKDTHRAIEDVHESVEELLHYKKYFFHSVSKITTVE